MRSSDWSSDVCSSDLRTIMMHIVKAKDHRHRGIRDQIFGEVIKILTDQDEADTKFANFTRHSVHDVLVIGRHKLMRLVDDNEGVGIVALAARLRLEKQALEQNFCEHRLLIFRKSLDVIYA